MGISNDIISFLFVYKKLNLPGLGLLELIRNPARRNAAKNKIIGPGYSIEFHTDKYDEKIFNNFVNFLSSKHNISLKKAENTIRKYSLELLNNIANFGSASIDNLGIFTGKNGKFHFELSPVLAEIIKESYPDYSLPYIKREKKEVISSTGSVTTEKQNKASSEKNWIFPFIILTISSIIFVCMIYCFSNLLSDNNSKQIVSDTTNTASGKIFTPDTSEEFPFEEVQDTTEQSQGTTAENADTLNTADKDLNTDTSTAEIPEKVTLEELIKMAPELRKKYEKSCIIITGSFIRKSNASRMISRLQKDGFTPYSEKYGRFHRTGVIFDCNKKPLKSFLKELRQSIDRDSWILKWK
jgi:hypothetical protein